MKRPTPDQFPPAPKLEKLLTEPTVFDKIEKLNWLHSLMQELEDDGVVLPMGDYMEVYDIIETIRVALYQLSREEYMS